jgi:hypothetical protein
MNIEKYYPRYICMTTMRIRVIFFIVATAGLMIMEAEASPPMAVETISSIKKTVQACTGGQYTYGTTSRKKNPVDAADIIPSVDLLAKSALLLSEEQSEDIYEIGKALLAPAINRPSWFPDRTSSFLKCPTKPKEGVEIFKYLAGEAPNELRASSTVFDWLGLAYAAGVGTERDEKTSRKYHLLSRTHFPFAPSDSWSDGIDTNLVSNINRAGLRPYLEALAKGGQGAGSARIILADEALPKDAPRARNLLLYPDYLTLNRLVQLEEQGVLQIAKDGSDIDVWAEAWRNRSVYGTLSKRLLESVILANGGAIATSSKRATIGRLRPYLDMERIANADSVVYASQQPISVRALVNRQGRAIYIEPCQQKPGSSRYVAIEVIYAARLYNVTTLPLMPISFISGRPAFGWVLLPAVHFQRDKKDKLKIEFAELPAEQCAFTAVPVYVPPTLSPSNK